MSNRANAKAMLSTKIEELTCQDQQSLNTATDIQESPSKQPKTVVIKCLAEILEEDGLQITDDSDSPSVALEKYLAEPIIPFYTGNANT